MADALAAIALLGLIFYALTGGADYGGGVWDLLATGPRAAAQRALIADAISPIWEANHVWLILVIVILFSAFPPAFAAIATALHIPLTLMLVGIVLRGSAFTFRAYDTRRASGSGRGRWGVAFSVASLVTPVLLGVNLGALSSGRIVLLDGQLRSGFIHPWLSLFPFAVGLLSLCLFAYLAAVYLAVEAAARKDGAALAEDFRARALASAGAAAVVALGVLGLARGAAPVLYARLLQQGPLLLFALALAGLAALALLRRRYALARAGAAGQVAIILLGWGRAQYPYLILPGSELHQAAAPPTTLRLLLWVLGLGVPVLIPSFFYLFRVFKSRQQEGG
jgi:cytochrome d ubiquinol oxidase subunit II